MFVRIGKILLVIALAIMLGAHWAVLQTVAWTTMLADNLQSGSIPAAITRTFDGQHPCCLCKAIAAAKKSEKKSAVLSSGLKLEFLLAAAGVMLFAPARIQFRPQQGALAGPTSSKPPVPPPRGLFA